MAHTQRYWDGARWSDHRAPAAPAASVRVPPPVATQPLQPPTHFSSVAAPGYKSLDPGQSVALEWEVVEQDGFSYRAVRTWPAGEQPVPDHDDQAGSSKAYRSTLTITYDDGPASPSSG